MKGKLRGIELCEKTQCRKKHYFEKEKNMKKIIAILLCMTIILGSFNHQISAKDYREDDFTLYENYDQYADEMSKIENYVTIENGKYALKLTKEAEKLFSRDSINYAQNHINALNYVIKRNSVSGVSFPPMVYKYRGALSDQVACQTENGGHTPFINLP